MGKKDMNYISIRCEGPIAFVSINRPKELNALNAMVLNELENAFQSIDSSTTRCVVVQGTGDKAFAAGADIIEMATMSRIEAKTFSEYGNKVFSMIANLIIPTIALVRGFALGGGCELALACDIRIASESAVFGQPETRLGIIPGFGGTQRLSRLVGLSKAKEIIFTGRHIAADEALKIGLVDHVYSESIVDEKTIELANEISSNAPIAIKNAKTVMNLGYEQDVSRALLLESEFFSKTFETLDQTEGMSAFIEKRKHKPYLNR